MRPAGVEPTTFGSEANATLGMSRTVAVLLPIVQRFLLEIGRAAP